MSFHFSNLNSHRSLSSGTQRSETSHARGFTLLEMMVVITIITVMTGVLLGNLPNFRDNTTLQLVTQEVAVTIRGAQVFGIGTKVERNQFLGHGMYFCTPSEVNEACKKNFLLFSDLGDNPDNYFENADTFKALSSSGVWISTCDNPNNECSEVYSLSGNIEVCDILIDGGPASQVSVTFSRLYPDASIKDSGTGDEANKVDIYLKSSRNNKRRVITVYNTGAISVNPVADNGDVCQATII